MLLGESRTHATAGNWNNRIGVPMTLFGLDSDQHDFAVIEAGINQPGEMVELGGMIDPDLSVVTNIASAHLELLGSLEQIATEKADLALCARTNTPVVLPTLSFNMRHLQPVRSGRWCLPPRASKCRRKRLVSFVTV